jgi:putative endopeptidase
VAGSSATRSRPPYSLGEADELAENNQSNLLTILPRRGASGNTQASEDIRKLGIFYSSCMDSAAAERAGIQPIKAELDRINAVKTRRGLETAIARLHSKGVPLLFGFGAQQDFKNSTSVIGGINQGGLSLPDRDYYLNTEKELRRHSNQLCRSCRSDVP